MWLSIYKCGCQSTNVVNGSGGAGGQVPEVPLNFRVVSRETSAIEYAWVRTIPPNSLPLSLPVPLHAPDQFVDIGHQKRPV